jgi:hypothetical protein
MTEDSQILRRLTCALIITVCFWVGLSFGFQAYATFIEPSGYRSNLHTYHELSIAQFGLYNLTIGLLTIPISLLAINYTIHHNLRKLNWTYLAFCLFMLLVILAERYLDGRFVGKG